MPIKSRTTNPEDTKMAATATKAAPNVNYEVAVPGVSAINPGIECVLLIPGIEAYGNVRVNKNVSAKTDSDTPVTCLVRSVTVQPLIEAIVNSGQRTPWAQIGMYSLVNLVENLKTARGVDTLDVTELYTVVTVMPQPIVITAQPGMIQP